MDCMQPSVNEYQVTEIHLPENSKILSEFTGSNLRTEYMRMEKILQETMSRLKVMEDIKKDLNAKNSLLIDDNKGLYEKLLMSEKGRILAEKESCELMQKMKGLIETKDAEVQSLDPEHVSVSDVTTFTENKDDMCESCGTVKVITCTPPDAIFITRKDLNQLDADMKLLKFVLTKKEEAYNDVIENGAATKESVQVLNKEIHTLRNINRFKDISLDEKEVQIQEMTNTIREMKEKLTAMNSAQKPTALKKGHFRAELASRIIRK